MTNREHAENLLLSVGWTRADSIFSHGQGYSTSKAFRKLSDAITAALNEAETRGKISMLPDPPGGIGGGHHQP